MAWIPNGLDAALALEEHPPGVQNDSVSDPERPTNDLDSASPSMENVLLEEHPCSFSASSIQGH
jgi:hypothetical protein